MSMDSTGTPAAAMDEAALRHEAHEAHEEANYSTAHASVLEKAFIWIGWALAAGFIGVTMSLYFSGLIAAGS